MSGPAPGPRLLPLLLACCLVGWIRNALEVAFGIQLGEGWYSWHADIVLSMMGGVAHLVFFGGMWLDITGRWLRVSVPASSLLDMCIRLSGLHLMVPFLDYLGNVRLGWPHEFPYARPSIHSPFFTTDLVMTTGILVGWLIVAITLFRWYHVRHRVGIGRTLALLTLSFQPIFWPVYHLWPAMNSVYYWLLNRPHVWGRDFGGYAMYFLLCSLLGVWYFKTRHHLAW